MRGIWPLSMRLALSSVQPRRPSAGPAVIACCRRIPASKRCRRRRCSGGPPTAGPKMGSGWWPFSRGQVGRRSCVVLAIARPATRSKAETARGSGCCRRPARARQRSCCVAGNGRGIEPVVAGWFMGVRCALARSARGGAGAISALARRARRLGLALVQAQPPWPPDRG
jgi:hypothetical protein